MEHTITLTARQVTLIRVALLQRLDRLKTNMEGRNPAHPGDAVTLGCLKASYDETRAMMVEGGVLSLTALKEAPLLKATLDLGAELGSVD